MKRSKHSLSHFKLLTCKMGSLVPISWFEVLPGDTVQQATSALIRCMPLVTPVMHPCIVRFHHFYVPNRIIWSTWENYITGGADGLDAQVPPHMVIQTATPPAVGSLADHLGVPTGTPSAGYSVSALPFRAYAKIYNEYYRDEDLQSALPVSVAAGLDSTTNLTMQNCGWEKDYFTSARPWAQKGASVTMPLGNQAVVKTSSTSLVSGTQNPWTLKTTSGTFPGTAKSLSVAATTGQVQGNDAAPGANPFSTYPDNLYADLSSATAVEINVVRRAFALQRFEEARARYGSRYTEYLRYLGVRSSDARLQRPEYLGGGKNTIQFSEVLQTGPGAGGTGIGNLFGHGITAMRTNRYRRFFEEHGIVMTLMSIRPKTMYTQGVARKFLRGISSGVSGMTGTKEDYWQRELQHIGQQQINGMEVDVQNPNFNFGFQDRYDEYRREESHVSGLFRTTFDTWHLGRKFAGPPTLNASFVSCVPSTRIFADTTSDNMLVMANQSIQARRLVAKEGTSMTF